MYNLVVDYETKVISLKDNRKLCFIAFGNPKGEPLFYFHGWPGSRLSGLETQNAANKLGVRVISLDRPGFGKSDYKAGRTLLDWADDVAEVADRLGINKFSVVGYSGGGPYVVACAYKIPNRINKAGIVVGLAPVDVPGNLDGMSLKGIIGWKNYNKHSWLRKISSLGAKIMFGYFSFSKNIQQTKEAFRQGIKGPSLDLKLYTDDWGFDLSEIRVPVYLWYGGKDKNVPLNMGKYYKSQIPQSTLFIDKGGNHFSRYKYEERILSALVK